MTALNITRTRVATITFDRWAATLSGSVVVGTAAPDARASRAVCGSRSAGAAAGASVGALVAAAAVDVTALSIEGEDSTGLRAFLDARFLVVQKNLEPFGIESKEKGNDARGTELFIHP